MASAIRHSVPLSKSTHTNGFTKHSVSLQSKAATAFALDAHSRTPADKDKNKDKPKPKAKPNGNANGYNKTSAYAKNTTHLINDSENEENDSDVDEEEMENENESQLEPRQSGDEAADEDEDAQSDTVVDKDDQEDDDATQHENEDEDEDGDADAEVSNAVTPFPRSSFSSASSSSSISTSDTDSLSESLLAFAAPFLSTLSSKASTSSSDSTEWNDGFAVAAASQLPNYQTLLSKISASCGSAEALLLPLLDRFIPGTPDSFHKLSDGISFLNLKTEMFFHYFIELILFFILRIQNTHSVKAESGENENDTNSTDVLKGLIEMRISLEKMRPLEKKMKYSIDKLLNEAIDKMKRGETAHSDNDTKGRPRQGQASARENTAEDETRVADIDGADEWSEKNPLSYRPNPSALLAKSLDDTTSLSSSSSSSTGGVDDGESQEFYRPNRISTTVEDVDSKSERERRKQERAQERLRKNVFLQSMHQEIYGESEKPEEIVYGDGRGDRTVAEVDREEKERIDYEEDNMLRLIETKEMKKRQREKDRARTKMLNEDEMDNFNDLYHMIDKQDKDKRKKMAMEQESNPQKKRMRQDEDGDDNDEAADRYDGVADDLNDDDDAGGDDEWMRAAGSGGNKRRRGGGGGSGGRGRGRGAFGHARSFGEKFKKRFN